jgi:hypothetical protein
MTDRISRMVDKIIKWLNTVIKMTEFTIAKNDLAL